MDDGSDAVVIKQEYLDKCESGLEFAEPTKKVKKFSGRKNLIIGPNGGGKTRLLKAVKDQAENIYGRKMHIIFLDFPMLFEKSQEYINEKIEIPFEIHGIFLHEEKLEDEQILPFINVQIQKLIEELFKEAKGAKTRKLRKKSVYHINKYMGSLLNRCLFIKEAEDGLTPRDGLTIYSSANDFIEDLKLLSPGERNLICIIIFLSIIAVDREYYKDMLILIDEPELHLHYSAVQSFITMMEELFKDSYVWVASHSVHLLSHYKFDEITYVENGIIERLNGKVRKKATDALLGEDNYAELLLDIDSWEYMNFVRQCFDPAEAVETAAGDPQFQVFLQRLRERVKNNGEASVSSTVHILDFGAGTGRFGHMLKSEESEGKWNKECLWYHTYYLKEGIERDAEFDSTVPRGNDYGRDIRRLFDLGPKFDIVLLVNTLHEIPVNDWEEIFKTIAAVLKNEGYLFFCEALTLPMGEKPTDHGFLVLGKEELEELFYGVKARTDEKERIVFAQIPRNNLIDITYEKEIKDALLILYENSKKRAKDLNASIERQKSSSAIKRAFYAMQAINAEIALEYMEKEISAAAVGEWEELGQPPEKWMNNMSPDSFRLHLNRELKNAELNRKQTLYYVWVCLVRALPFLFYHGNFNFWAKGTRQKNLSVIFFALDYVAAVVADIDKVALKSFTDYGIDSTSKEAITIVEAIQRVYKITEAASAGVPTNVVFAVYSAVFDIAALDVTPDAYIAASAISFTAFLTGNAQIKNEVQNLLLDDIRTIKAEDKAHMGNVKAIYGTVWDQFRTILGGLGCGYYYRLYKDIFANNFQFDKEELIYRLNAPEEIATERMEHVAGYVEEKYPH